MDFKSLLSQLDQLNEAEGTTVHKGTYGTSHGKEDVRDQYGHKIGKQDKGAEAKKDAPKKGRGRPKKGADDSGEVKSYDFSAFGVNKGKDVKLPKHDKKKTIKHSLKEYLDQLDDALNEEYTTAPMPGAVQVKDASGKVVATAKNPAAAKAFQDGDITLGKPEEMEEGSGDPQITPRMKTQYGTVVSVDGDKVTVRASNGELTTVNIQDIDQGVAEGLDDMARKVGSLAKTVAGRIAGAPKEVPYEKPHNWEGNPKESIEHGVEEGLGDIARKVGGAVASGAKKVVDRLSGETARQDAIKKRLADREPPSLASQLSRSSGNQNGVKNPHEYDRGQEYDRISSHNGRYAESAKRIAGSQMKKIKEADQPPRDALASPLTLEAKKPDKNKNRIPDYAEDGKGKNDLKKVKEDMGSESKTDKLPSMAHIKKMCKDGKTVAEICKMHPNCDQKELKQMVADCKKKMIKEGQTPMKNIFVILDDNLIDQIANMNGAEVDPDAGTVETWDENTFNQLNAFAQKNPTRLKRAQSMNTAGMRPMARQVSGTATGPEYNLKEGMDHRLKAARHMGKAHALTKEGYNCRYDDMEESRHYHEGYKEGLDECYGQMPVLGLVVGETGMPAATVPGMASQAMQEPTMEDDMYEMDKSDWMAQKAKSTPGDTFKAFGQTFKDKEVVESPFAFEALEQQLNALLESKADVAEGMTVSISKGQQGAPDSVSVSAQDGEADQLLDIIKSAGLGLFGGDNTNGYGAPQGGQPQHGGLDVVGDHDGMMALIKKVTGGEAGNGDYADEEGHADEHGHEGACESCGGMMEAGHSCDEGQQMVDEVESEDQMTYQMAEDNPPDSGADNTDAAIADTAQANQAAAEYNPRNDVDEGAGGPEASEEPVEKLTPDEEDQSDEEGEEEKSAEEEDKADKESMSESMFVNLYKKLTLISEESTSEKDDKAEKAAKKVAKDIEYDEDHKGKDDDKAEEAGKKVKKDIEYDDKKDKKEKKEKIDEWANDAGPGKSASDTSFETDMDFMMNVISGGLNKRKSTGQTTIPVLSSQLGRQVSRNTTDINETVGNSSDAVAQWKKLAGLK